MLIDLSQPITANTPVYPGDAEVKIEAGGNHDADGYYDNVLTLATHVGTHVDAPIHMVKDGRKLKDFPIDKFVGHGVCINVANGEFKLADLKAANIQTDDIVLFNTGMSQKYGQDSYFEDYPQIPEVIAQYLIDSGVKMVGIDMASPDHEPFDIHKMLLSNEVLIIENLCNLDQLIDKNFKVYAVPMNLQEDGAPARVFAEIVD